MEVTPVPMESLAELLSLQMESGGVARLVVTGSSMHPTLRHRRDAVFLRSVERELKRGDLILYRRANGRFVLHRIVSKPKGDMFFCAGDNQWQREVVTASQVLAITDGFVRNKKNYAEDNLFYRSWVSFWIMLLPVRRPILSLRRCLGRIRKAIH